MPSASTALKKTARVTSLDGLRGLAAVVVLVHHALLTAPVLASAYYGGSVSDASDPVSWALTYTPLHLIWAGTEAVYLFFVLSGVVLTFPVLRSRSFSWLAYYPSRLLRLYGPIVFAVLLGSPIGGTTVLFTLPEVPLPGWLESVRLGGRVTGEAVMFAACDGLRLATLLICLGAANALANPARLLKSLPGALYEAGVAVVVMRTSVRDPLTSVDALVLDCSASTNVYGLRRGERG